MNFSSSLIPISAAKIYRKETLHWNSINKAGQYLEKSAIVLAGGFSTRFGKDKGLLKFQGKPLIEHVLDTVNTIIDEMIVVVSSKAQHDEFSKAIHHDTQIIVDKETARGPLMGALTGFEKAQGNFSLLLSCDIPLVSEKVLLLLLELCYGKNAVIPRWSNGYLEPLHAVYFTKTALSASRDALKLGKADMQSMIKNLGEVRYISTRILSQIDPKLDSFFNINTPLDLIKAESRPRTEKIYHGRVLPFE
ncbi:MAG: molybdenum cofactor guanylyltransferase [Candidatus Bathyarchaeota archaeon]